jgi:hypothetical protein
VDVAPVDNPDLVVGEAIRSGMLDPEDPTVLAYLKASTLSRMAIDQPGYATFKRAVARDGAM